MESENSMPQDGTIWLKGSGRGHEGGSWLFRNPVDELRADSLDEVERVLKGVDRAIRRGRWVAGFLTYEAGYAFEPGLFRDPSTAEKLRASGCPLAWFGVYKGPSEQRPPPVPNPETIPSLSLHPDEDPAVFKRAVERIREWIRIGDVYQINMTTRFRADVPTGTSGMPISGADLFSGMRRNQPADFSAWIRAAGLEVFSFSPELFFERDGAHMLMRPMKGTAPRGRTTREDREQAEWLRSDAKSRAENLMIVDLIRNDLSIVSQPGSVRVPSLFQIETYPTLLQMTSAVTSELAGDPGYLDLFRALFPSGSVTGAPKKRAMRRILELESTPRGVYCGAIGFMAPDQRAVFSVAIRTAVVSGGEIRYGTGGGIVWDSEAESEWDEAVLKSRFLSRQVPTSGFRLIETMRMENRQIPLLGAHLDRLLDSARYFGWDVDRSDVEGRIDRTRNDAGLPSGKLRVLLSSDGSMYTSVSALEPPRPVPWKLGLSAVVVDSSDAMLYHKTTHREFYDKALEEAVRRGLDEVLLTNEHGFVTEGAITNLFIRSGSIWKTPRPESGMLSGVSRAAFLDTHAEIREMDLRPEDVRLADEIVLTNGVIGEVRAVWVDS